MILGISLGVGMYPFQRAGLLFPGRMYGIAAGLSTLAGVTTLGPAGSVGGMTTLTGTITGILGGTITGTSSLLGDLVGTTSATSFTATYLSQGIY